MSLRHVDPPARPSWFARHYAALAATPVARWISRHVNWKIDPILLRLTGGRFASTLMFPTALLETTGARTGSIRRNPVIYFHDGDIVTIVASNAGDATHPAWLHNLRANPAVSFAGDKMTATIVEDEEERRRLWALADRVFPAFKDYRRDADRHGRQIPIVQLRPR
jgi:deazaflavin-dependent oxidoreductase (nitroreductase family)